MNKEKSGTPATRGLSLFANFFFIILSYYLIKPASRSIFLDHFAAVQLPYVWICSALILGALMPFYGALVDRLDRRRLVIASCAGFSLLVFGFGMLFRHGYSSPSMAVAFYILADILSVMLVEQFWSLANSNFSTNHGSRWYGLVGSGGLVGGIAGGVLAAWLLNNTSLVTYDLPFVSAFLLAAMGIYAYALMRKNIYVEQKVSIFPPGMDATTSFKALIKNRYILLIALTVMIAQLVEPIVEYQFMSMVEQSYLDRDSRTQFLSAFLGMLGGVALAINLVITPVVLSRLGAIAGLIFQPALLLMSSFFFYSHTSLAAGSVMKIADRGLSYSLNRAAKEMLYIPLDPALIYRAKAMIDMFGYRLFKIAGSVLVLLPTQWLAIGWQPQHFSIIVAGICCAWMLVVLSMRHDYNKIVIEEQLKMISVRQPVT